MWKIELRLEKLRNREKLKLEDLPVLIPQTFIPVTQHAIYISNDHCKTYILSHESHTFVFWELITYPFLIPQSKDTFIFPFQIPKVKISKENQALFHIYLVSH